MSQYRVLLQSILIFQILSIENDKWLDENYSDIAFHLITL